ncbi:hypothetical protein PVAND_001944 [Polypedilum vanderplanki]|uniref:WD repeat-containing protein 44 n=1 Tax=Polypedilum vanderplanki TaxID=319348 RepID=A0A9J6BQV8_POLVA|nr:hypothetical protein PVAND_001944 [Polypedilum vanderplanki]
MASSDGSSDEFFECESPTKSSTKRNSKEDNPFDFKNSTSSSVKDEILEIQRQQQESQEPKRDDFHFVEPRSDPSNSSTKSADAASRNTVQSSHPFRVIDNDGLSIHSMQSLGRVGRILSGSLEPGALSVNREQQPSQSPLTESPSNNESQSTINTTKKKNEDSHSLNSSNSQIAMSQQQQQQRPIILQEPDVIASTKLAHSKTTDSITSAGSVAQNQNNQAQQQQPIAPPRFKRKKTRLGSNSSEHQSIIADASFKLPPSDKLSNVFQQPPTVVTAPTVTTSSLTVPMSTTTADSFSNNTQSNDNIEATSRILPSPATLHAITREIENSFKESSDSPTTSIGSPTPSNISRFTGSLNKISTNQQYHKPSPSNSVKSSSAPGRVSSSMDPHLTMSIHKVTQGNFCVKPQDEVMNRGEGLTNDDDRKRSTTTMEDIERLHKMRNEISSGERLKWPGIGSNSLGNDTRYRRPEIIQDTRERRKSAGDEELFKQLNVNVRMRSDSGQQLTDKEILDQVPVKNLDTGENFPLSVADEKAEQCINPLSLYIMQYASHIRESDEESVGGATIGSEIPPEEEENEEEEGRLKRKTVRIKKFFKVTAQKAASKAKSIASEVSHARHKEDIAEIPDVANPEQTIKIKASKTNTGPYEFSKIQHVQDLSGEQSGAVWCMKFSPCGRMLATGGQDKLLRIWVIKEAYQTFEELIKKFNADQKSSPTPSQESLVSHQSFEESAQIQQAVANSTGPFIPLPYRTYSGHTSDLLDVSWSKSHFILSSSMDKTVRLWHISRRECLCCFQHIEFVTAIAFHPQDDSFFISGSLDGRLRLWNIPNKKVFLWNEIDGRRQLITAVNFCQNGKFAVIGTYDGRCLFYNTEQLKYHTQIHVRSTRGKNATGRKITGIEPMPNEDKILVTSNDSRIRLYDLRDLGLSCKYKGYVNDSQQIKASFSHDGKYIISGSENQSIYLWKTHHDFTKLSSVRRDRSDFWEGIKAHNATVTCAIFSPHPETIIKPEHDNEVSEKEKVDPLVEQRTKGCGGYVMVSVDFTGCIKVFVNKTKPKHSSLPYTAYTTPD